MNTKFRILVLNGPNINLIGTREPEHYGLTSLDDLIQRLSDMASAAGAVLTHLQSNREYELIEAIHAAKDNTDYVLINPAAFTHTSVALRDALLGVDIPFIEIHLSNVYAREAFRHHSYFSDKAQAVLCGFGTQGYEFALAAALSRLQQTTN